MRVSVQPYNTATSPPPHDFPVLAHTATNPQVGGVQRQFYDGANISTGPAAPDPSLNITAGDISPDGLWIGCNVEIMGHTPYSANPTLKQYEINNGWFLDRVVCTLDGSAWYNLTNQTPTPPQLNGVLAAKWSPDQNWVCWASPRHLPIVGSKPIGGWRLFLAGFAVVGGVPTFTSQQTIRDSDTHWYEPIDWLPDSSGFLIATDDGAINQYAGNTFRVDVDGTFHQITPNDNRWKEHGAVSPDGTKLASEQQTPPGNAVESIALPEAQWRALLSTDLWLCDIDGGNPLQLTYFNTPGNIGYSPVLSVTPFPLWNSTGDQIRIKQQQAPGEPLWLVSLLDDVTRFYVPATVGAAATQL